jgi:hypothetical protein
MKIILTALLLFFQFNSFASHRPETMMVVIGGEKAEAIYNKLSSPETHVGPGTLHEKVGKSIQCFSGALDMGPSMNTETNCYIEISEYGVE